METVAGIIHVKHWHMASPAQTMTLKINIVAVIFLGPSTVAEFFFFVEWGPGYSQR